MFNTCAERGIDFFYASSAGVYSDKSFKEDGPIAPSSNYAMSKAMFDNWVQEQQTQGIRVYGFRFFTCILFKEEAFRSIIVDPINFVIIGSINRDLPFTRTSGQFISTIISGKCRTPTLPFFTPSNHFSSRDYGVVGVYYPTRNSFAWGSKENHWFRDSY